VPTGDIAVSSVAPRLPAQSSTFTRRQPLEKATAEIPDEEKGQSQTYVGFEPARETHLSRNGYRAIRDARIDGVLTGKPRTHGAAENLERALSH
jgi:hypothetical protein